MNTKKCKFEQGVAEPMCFHYQEGNDRISAGYYVDDGRVMTNRRELAEEKARILADNGLVGKVRHR